MLNCQSCGLGCSSTKCGLLSLGLDKLEIQRLKVVLGLEQRDLKDKVRQLRLMEGWQKGRGREWKCVTHVFYPPRPEGTCPGWYEPSAQETNPPEHRLDKTPTDTKREFALMKNRPWRQWRRSGSSNHWYRGTVTPLRGITQWTNLHTKSHVSRWKCFHTSNSLRSTTPKSHRQSTSSWRHI